MHCEQKLTGVLSDAVIPSSIVSLDFSSFGTTFGQVFKADFSAIKIMDLIVIMFAFLFVDMFDTLGTLIGVASKADMLDKDGKLPRIKPALLADGYMYLSKRPIVL